MSICEMCECTPCDCADKDVPTSEAVPDNVLMLNPLKTEPEKVKIKPTTTPQQKTEKKGTTRIFHERTGCFFIWNDEES